MKIARKVLIFMLGVALPPVLALISYTYIELLQTTTNTTITNLQETSQKQKTKLDQIYYGFREKASNMSSRSELRLVTSDKKASVDDIEDILYRYRKESTDIDEIAVIDSDGTIVASTRESNENTVLLPKFSLAMFDANGYVHKFDGKDSEQLYFLSPIGPKSSAFRFLVLKYNTGSIMSVLRDYASLGKSGETVLAKRLSDNSVQFIGQSRNMSQLGYVDTTAQNRPIQKAVDRVEESLANTIDYRKQPVIAVTTYLPLFDWGMVVKVDRAEALASIQILLQSYIIIAVITVIIVFIAAWYFANIVTSPLIQLTEITKKIEESKKWKQKINITSHDEFGTLARSYERMMKTMDDLYSQMDEKVRIRTQELSDSMLELVKFKLAVENASDHIVISDKDGIIVYVNPAVEKITGFSPDEVIGQRDNSPENWGGQMPEEFMKKMWHIISVKKQTFHGEITNKRKSGELYLANVSVTPIVDKSDEILFYVSIEHDITKEKEIDRAKTEFVSLASHQLRTPLSAISWYTEMLLDGDVGKITRAQKDCLEEIHHGRTRMVDLVNSLLNVSRLEIGTFIIDPTPLQIVDIAKEALKELEPQIMQKKLLVETALEKVPVTPLDKKLTFMIFQNLLSNAVKYTPEKGVVTLKIGKDNEFITIEVSDSGIGIPKDQQDKIFQKLFRARNATEQAAEGTGLGLYIVKTILDNSGGDITFVSTEGKGTTFTAHIPLKGMKEKKGTKALN